MSDITLKAPKGRVRIAILAFYYAQGLGFASWASRIPTIKTSLDMDEAMLGSVLLSLPIGQLIAMPFSGHIISRYGSIRVLTISLLFYSLALICIGCATNIIQLTSTLIILGIFGNFINIAVNTQGVYIEDYYRRPIMASFHGGWSLAGFSGALLGLLAINLKINPLFHFIGIAIIISALIFFNYKYLFPDLKRDKSAPTEPTKPKFRFRKPEKLLIQLGIIGFCGMASEGAMFDWSGVYFQKIVQAPDSLILLGYAAFMIMMATGRFMADKLIVEFGRQKVMQICGILISSGLLLSVLFPNIVICTIAFMIVGLGVSSIIPIVYSIAGKESVVPANIALVIVSSISFIGFLMGPPLIGHIAHILNLRYSFALIALFGVCIFVLTLKIQVFKKKI